MIHYDYGQIADFLDTLQHQMNQLNDHHEAVTHVANNIEWHDEHSAEAYQAAQKEWGTAYEDMLHTLQQLHHSAEEASHAMQETNSHIASSWSS